MVFRDRAIFCVLIVIDLAVIGATFTVAGRNFKTCDDWRESPLPWLLIAEAVNFVKTLFVGVTLFIDRSGFHHLLTLQYEFFMLLMSGFGLIIPMSCDHGEGLMMMFYIVVSYHFIFGLPKLIYSAWMLKRRQRRIESQSFQMLESTD